MIQTKLIAALGGLLAFVGAYFFGRHDGSVAMGYSYEKAANESLKKDLIANKKAYEEDLVSATNDSKSDTIIRETVREIPKIIAGDVVYRNVCINTDGVRTIRAGIAAANGDSGDGVDGTAGKAPDAHNDGH